MKTSFSKKFLACVLSVCMILTVCAGALSVSAAAAGTATIAQVEVASDATEAIVPVTLTADEAIGGAELYITVPAVANITKVDIATAGYDLTFASGETDLTATAGAPVTADVDEVDNVAKFVLLGNGDFTGVATTVVINLTFAGAFAADTTYDVDFAAGTMVGTADAEAAVALTTTKGAIKVAAAHVCSEYTYTDNGDNHTKACKGCDYSVVEDHTYVEGTCVCGAKEPVEGPIVDEELVVAGAAPSYGTSSIYVNFRIRNNILTKYSNMELVIIPQKYDATTLNLVDPVEIVVPYAELSGTGTFRTYAYEDIMLYELGLEIQYMLRGTNADGNAVQSPVYTTSVASYFKTLYEGSDDAAFRTVIVDTLVVGDTAARTFGIEGSDLAAAPSILEGFDISEATPSVDSYNTVDTHNAIDSDWGDGSTGTHRVAKGVTIGKVPYVSYRIRGASSIDLDKLSFTVSYTQITGVGTTEQYSKTFTSADTANLSKSGSFVIFKFDEVGLGDSNADISFVATYDGAEVFNSTYSIETYLGANTSNETTGDLAVALLKLGASFRVKFT